MSDAERAIDSVRNTAFPGVRKIALDSRFDLKMKILDEEQCRN